MKKIIALIILISPVVAFFVLFIRDHGVGYTFAIFGLFVIISFILTWCFRQLEK